MNASSGQVKKKPRDPRLDLFRGLAMFIIFIAHMPHNSWTLWIPARFGYSDATEIFVFCSGMASSFAFAAVFANHSWWMGTARIAHRIWQVYWAQIGLFLAIAVMLWIMQDNKEALVTFLRGSFDPDVHGSRDFVGALNLRNFFDRPGENLVGLMTLTYVPNYFDILPMYLGILAMVPIVMLLHRWAGFPAVIVFCLSLWALANLGNFDAFLVKIFGGEGFGFGAFTIEFPAEPWSDRPWFFNPLGWQLVFFTGFAFGLGWLKQPPVRKGLLILALAIVLINIPLRFHPVLRNIADIQDVIGFFPDTKVWNRALAPLGMKTEFGILRYIHFLALAYLAWAAFGKYGWPLLESRIWGPTITVIRKVGQQSLAVFLMSMLAARGIGEIVWIFEKTELARAIGNLVGFAILIATAYIVSWIKSQPWRKVPVKPEPQAMGDNTPVQQPAQ